MDLLTQFLIAILAILLVPIYFYYTKLYRIEKFFKNFPTPPTVPILGNAYVFTSTQAFLKKLHEFTKAYGNNVHLKMGPIGHVLVSSDYSLLEFLLSHNKLLKKSENLKFLKPWIGNGLVTADGDAKWKTHRRLITPTFHFKILEQFVDVFEAGGDNLVKNFEKMNGSKSFDIYPYITQCTLHVICETAMGTKVDVENSDTLSYFQSVKDMCKIFLIRTTSVINRYDFFFQFSKYNDVQKKALKVLHRYTNSVIDERRKQLKEKVEENLKDEDLGIKKKKVFLDLLLEAKVDGQSLSQDEIREEVDTFMFGGHDTTASASSFILYCLANNKDVQDKVLEEQQQLFGNDKNPKVTYTNLQEMKYLENVIKEGLRLYSPVPVFGRQISEDVEWNGLIIPKGVSVIIFVHGMHMNPKYYTNPEKFDPTRFEDIDGKLPYAFIPFSAGPRNCIGQKYAILELKSLVSKIIRNFELLPAFPHHEMELTAETVLISNNGVKIGIKKR